MKTYQTVDEYIASFEPPMQELLTQMRATIKRAAPEATEKIAYGIPTFVLHGNLVHFGGFASHISFFPASAGVEAYKDELKDYKTGRGTIQFPLDKPLPLNLITRITKFRAEQNLQRK